MSLLEMVDTRVLGAFRFVDASTRGLIKRSLEVSCEEASFLRNRCHHYVVTGAAGLSHHLSAFYEAPDTPALASINIDITVRDPLQRYLPRTVTMALPRDPDPANSHQPDSLFTAQAVPMYPASSFALRPNWSAIRAALTVFGEPQTPLAGALLRVVRVSDGALLARGVSDLRGEALVIVPGIAITNFSTSDDDEGADASGPVTIAETAVNLEVIAGDTVLWPVNPDVLERNRTSLIRNEDEPVVLTLRTGLIETVKIEVNFA